MNLKKLKALYEAKQKELNDAAFDSDLAQEAYEKAKFRERTLRVERDGIVAIAITALFADQEEE